MKDQTMPTSKWAFDEEVTAVFDDMLQRSIPQYTEMRKLVVDMSIRALDKYGADVVDIGCSRGEALASLLPHIAENTKCYGLEISQPMVMAARERFKGHPNVSIRLHDLRSDALPSSMIGLTLSVLTLQFVPLEHRQRVVRDIWRATKSGGTFILVEKVLGSTHQIDATMVDTYYDMKRRNGYSQAAIDAKRASLEGVLVPLTARWNEDMLFCAGFRQVDCFWRWMNFAAWVAIK